MFTNLLVKFVNWLEYENCLDASIKCGNEKHPDGPWHLAQHLKLGFLDNAIKHKYRLKKWGCICPRMYK